MKSCSFLAVSLLALLVPARCTSANNIDGAYEGTYRCAVSRPLNLQIRDLGHKHLSAVFTFPEGSYSMSGEYDERSGRFRLTPQNWLRQPPGFTMVGLEGVFDAGSNVLHGRVSNLNCGAFEAIRQAPGSASQAVPPERRRQVFNLTNYMTDSLEYWDATMDDPNKARESEPIDDVIDWLKSQGFSCLGSQQVVWNRDGTQGSANDRVTVHERYVIECDGNCTGLRYIPGVQATMWHFGATQPVPVMDFKSTWFGGTPIQWKLTRAPGSGPPPEVYIHRWSSGKFLSGRSCKAPKTNAH
jgi:hypothetical protein